MRKVFIADAHLRSAAEPNYRRLLNFLAEMQGNTETLFILGDLFEFWIGYRRVPFTHYYPILDQLRQLVESGTELVYFEGNHDFHMGPYFKDTLKARIYKTAATLELDGKRVYLCHGDQINRGDIPYRILRFLLHNSLSAALVPVVPVNLVTKVAERMGRMSKKGHQRHRLKWDHMAILKAFAAARFHEGCDVLITGHFHTPLMEKASSNGAKGILLSLGDWITQYSYGEWEDGQWALKTYTGV